jgi:hypothetical protein
MLISNPLNNFFKNSLQKLISKTSLMNMSKSGKSAYYRGCLVRRFVLLV